MREDLEKEILGNLLIHPERYFGVSQIVTEEDFVYHRKLFSELGKLLVSETPKNILLELSHKGFVTSDVVSLMDNTSFRTPETAAQQLKEIVTTDRTKKVLEKAVKDFPQEEIPAFIANLQQDLIKTVMVSNREKTDISAVLAEFKDHQTLYEEKARNGQELIGISCGFPKIDALIDGLRPGHIWAVGGYTSMGKTFLALNIIAHLIKQKKRVVFYTLEMSRVDLLARTLGIMVKENSRAIAKAKVDQNKINPALSQIEESDLTIISEQRELSQIILSMHEQTLNQPVDLFVIDYLGLVNVKGSRSEYEQMKAVALELQNAIKRFNVPLIELSQVSNESARSGEQMVMGFKGAGDIAAAADLAIELVSGEESTIELKTKMHKGEPVKIKCQIKKNRHGSVGYVLMEFDGKTGTFTEVNENNF